MPTPPTRTHTHPEDEFYRQVATYSALGVPALHDLTPTAFAELVRPLRDAALTRAPDRAEDGTGSAPAPAPATASTPSMRDPGRLPFVLVVPGPPPEQLMPLTRQGAHAGYVDMRPVDPSVFVPLRGAEIPEAPYLALDVDTGRQTLGVRPIDAAQQLAAGRRLPLTIDEGIAVLLLNPGLLRTANCYQMLASRDGSTRIPSLWVTGRGAPRLGWCYDRVPHSWLGAASCAARVAD